MHANIYEINIRVDHAFHDVAFEMLLLNGNFCLRGIISTPYCYYETYYLTVETI